jgi:hypothetical protein
VEIEIDCRAIKGTLCNDTLNFHHARWKDGIQGYYGTAVRHCSGTLNTAADALSRMYTGRECTTDDGSTWLVCEDWEALRGSVNNLFGIYPDELVFSLCEHFTDEPLFLEVVQAITKIDSHRNEHECNCTRHRAEGYQIEEGKLWCITDGKSIHAKPRLECISQTEAIELAKHKHHNNRHWGCNLMKLQPMDWIHSPRLDQSVTIAILQCPQCKNFGSSHLHVCYRPTLIFPDFPQFFLTL